MTITHVLNKAQKKQNIVATKIELNYAKYVRIYYFKRFKAR